MKMDFSAQKQEYEQKGTWASAFDGHVTKMSKKVKEKKEDKKTKKINMYLLFARSREHPCVRVCEFLIK